MKRNLIYVILLTQSLILSANELNPIMNQNSHNKEYQINKSSEIVKCNVVTENITFTHAINGADTCVNVLDNGALSFLCKEGLDFFCDPNGGELSNNTLPILLLPVNNTQPFTLTAKVTPEFSSEGLYNAADLFVYVSDTLWQKLAFEQDEYGNHRIVSVRTQGTSDDNNHDKISLPTVYLKISSDTRTIANYYSLDNKTWQMVRLYKNYYPENIFLGVSSQCPKKGICNSLLEDIMLVYDNVKDFRIGE